LESLILGVTQYFVQQVAGGYLENMTLMERLTDHRPLALAAAGTVAWPFIRPYIARLGEYIANKMDSNNLK